MSAFAQNNFIAAMIIFIGSMFLLYVIDKTKKSNVNERVFHFSFINVIVSMPIGGWIVRLMTKSANPLVNDIIAALIFNAVVIYTFMIKGMDSKAFFKGMKDR